MELRRDVAWHAACPYDPACDLGSTLISIGALDKTKFPSAQVVKKGNLVAALSPNEWEAVTAAQSVAATTKWTGWAGLPGSENLTKSLRDHDWGTPAESRGKAAEVAAALASASKNDLGVLRATYVRHAPIGPFLAVADVRADGTATVWTPFRAIPRVARQDR